MAACASSMALGLGFYAPPAAVAMAKPDRRGDAAARVSRKARSGRSLLLVRALREDDTVEITSMRGTMHDDHDNLFKRVLDWGQQVHRQATKFFRELADGSLLISFGEPSNANVPPRPPSRFSKQLPYVKRVKQRRTNGNAVGTSLAELPKRVPPRTSSTFSKKSPITQTSQRHRLQRSASSSTALSVSSDQADSIQYIDEIREEKTRRSRPKGSFSRQSPVPRHGGGRSRKRKLKENHQQVAGQPSGIRQEEQQTVNEENRSELGSSGIGKAAVSNTLEELGDKELSGDLKESVHQVVNDSASGNEFLDKTNRSLRPKATFFRKSPISTPLKGGRRKKVVVKVEDPPEEVTTAAVATARVEAMKVVTGSIKVAATKVDAEVMESSAAKTSSSVRRRRKIITESEFECSDVEDVGDASSFDLSQVDLSSLTIPRLRGIAKSKRLRGYSRLKKAELIDLLKQQE